MSFDDIMSGIRRLRTSIRISTGRPEAMPREKARLLGQNLVAKLQSGNQAQNQLQHLQASRNPTSNQGAQGQYTPRTTGPFGFTGFLRSNPPPQAPPPLTAEQKAELEKQKKLKELEAKKKLARERQYRLDNMRGLSVDRT